jgi:hippurate hydrolase
VSAADLSAHVIKGEHAMAFRVGQTYRQFQCSNGCPCGDPQEWASLLSRRGFIAAGVGAPVVFAGAGASSAAGGQIDASGAKSRIPPEAAKRIAAAVDADNERLVAIFKDIHQNPELGFMEVRTAKIVADALAALGCEVKTGIGKTGVVGILRNGDGPTVMYRADMDANAVEEATGLPYASKVRVMRDDGAESPVGHMCGHDAHVTWMLGAAKVMAENTALWRGTLVFVGQPAEEPIMGAKAMIDDGLYDRHGVPVPDHLIALHTALIPTGMLAAKPGVVMAGTDQIDVTFHGVGGHGSMPQYAKDPVIMGALAVVEYQMILSRVLNPLDAAVLTVGSFQAGSDNNVIPPSALLKLNTRFFDLKVREQMIEGVKRINDGIATTYGIKEDKLPSMVMKGHSPPLVNSDSLVERLHPALFNLVGRTHVVTDNPPATGSEDAHLLKGDHPDVGLAFLIVGVADPKLFTGDMVKELKLPFAAHNPDFRVDLNAIPLGAKVGALSVLELMVKA